jgi:undecaprenyl pyrophosphate phosphatase UppP
MYSHFLLLLIFSFLVAVVFGVLLRDDLRQQLRLAAVVLGGFVLSAIVLGWLMYPFPI